MKNRYALFDLDGTLTPMDLQALFRHYVLKKSPWRVVLLLPFLVMLPGKLLGLFSTATMKRAFLSYLWRVKPEEAEAWGRDFASQVADTLIFPEIRARLESLRADGARCVLNTASPDIYAIPLGAALGFPEVFATPLLKGAPYAFFPKLAGPNNKGIEKMPRMGEFLPDSRPVPGCVVFTDSSADLPMLEAASEAVLVSPNRKLKAAVKQGRLAKAEIEIMEPAMPWPGRRPGLMLWVKLLLGLGERPRFSR